MIYSKAKFKNSGDKSVSLFQTTPNRKHVRQMFAYTDSATGFIHGNIRLNENIIQDLPPNWTISFFEVYKELMHCFIVFPFFLKYLMNAEYMINSWPVVSKSHWWSQMISSAYRVNHDSRMMVKILYVVDKSEMLL